VTVALQSPTIFEVADELSNREKKLGPDHHETLLSASRLAELLLEQGQYKEAEELRRQVLASREKAQREHPTTMKSVNELGAVPHIRKQYQASSVLFRRYLDGVQKLSER
jgi:Tetratricopeptide repeat